MKRTLALLSLLLLASCWPGWDFLCDPTPSREHRVEDLRVLAIENDTPNVLVAPGLLFDEAPAVEPIAVRIAPRVFDPRGGGPIDVAIAVCASNAFGMGAGPPCPAGSRTLASVRTEADADAPLGALPDLERTVLLDTSLVRELYAEAGVPDGTLGVVFFELVVSVSRSVEGRVERESAFLPWFFQLDALSPDMPAARLDALLEAEGARVCGLDPIDGCTLAEEPRCGDGVVTQPESCEPPGSEGCDQSCYASDECVASMGGAVCVMAPVLPALPTLAGLAFSQAGAGFVVNEAPDILPGGVIEVPVGERVFLTPAVAIEDMLPTLQWVFPPIPACGPETPGARAQLRCDSGYPSTVTFRFYLGDGAAELVAPADPTSGYYGNSGYEAVAVAFADGTAAGSEEPLLVVIASDRGAMGTAVFTLSAR